MDPKDAPANSDVIRALREMALFLEMDEVPFKPAAYEKAADAIADVDRALSEIVRDEGPGALAKIPGVGKGIAERIAGMLAKGTMDDLEALRARTPIDIIALTRVEGVGPKKAKAIYDAIGVTSLAELAKAAESGMLRTIPRFGAKAEQKISIAVRNALETEGRTPLSNVLELSERLEAAIRGIDGVHAVAIAGSVRRRRDHVGNVDVVIASERKGQVIEALRGLREVRSILGERGDRTMVRLVNGTDAGVCVVAPDRYGAALLRYTGSDAHYAGLVALASARGVDLDRGATEEELYAALGLAFVPPELREDRGEIARAAANALPMLIEAGAIRGDLQMHTTWSDGAASVEDMARAAMALGRDYIALTDHARGLAVTQGLDPAALREQVKEIREVESRLGGFRILQGVETNVQPDGSVDVPDDALAELDFVGAAIHSHFDMPREAATARMIRAIEHPHVDVLFHPTTRQVAKRKQIDFDVDAVIAAAARTGTVLEIDAHPQRLDMPDAMVKKALEAGVMIAIDSDAHSPDELRYVARYGIAHARRGWVEARHVVNALSAAELLKTLKGARLRQRA